MLTLLILTTLVAADSSRCESSHQWEDGEVVLITASNRARNNGTDLLSELTLPAQFSQGCPVSPRTWHWRHLVLGWKAATGTLDGPPWSRHVVHFAGPSDPDPEELCARWGVVPLGRVVHTFCGSERLARADGARSARPSGL